MKMKKTVILMLATMLTFACAQASETCGTLTPGKDKVYEKCEVMPEYPGGQSAMMMFIGTNLVYPKDAITRGEQGKVCVGFVVDKDGSITDVSIIHSVSKTLDEAAIEVVKKMPKWTPGKHKGKVVRVKYALPIMFKFSK